MADVFGTAFGSDPAKLSPGCSTDAGTRRHRNVYDLATAGGGAQNDLVAAKVREGNLVYEARMHSTVALTAVNFTIGTVAAPAKYGAAQAGPAANASKTFQIPLAALDDDELAAPETIKFFPASALPASGVIVTEIFVSKR